MPTFITADAVARMLGLAGSAAFLHRRAELEDDHAFPVPMPHSRRPLLWRADEVAAWIDAQGRPRPARIAPRGDNVVLLAEARTA